MLLRTLLAHPGLDLRVLAGMDGLGRRVRHVFTTDLKDPGRYLSGGCLVLSGLLWWRGPRDCEEFAATLAEAGVAALAAGTAEHGFVPKDLVDACQRHRLVLLAVPEHVSFATITELVVLSLADEVADGAVPLDLPAALRQAGTALGAGCWLLSATARVIAANEPAPSLPLRRLLVRRGLTTVDSEREGALRSRGQTYTVLPVTLGSPLAGWLLAIAADARSWTRAQRHTVDGLLGVARTELSRVDDARLADTATRTAVLRAVLAPGHTPPEVIARLAAAGLSERLAVLTASVDDQGPALAVAVLDELAAQLGLPALVAEVDGEAFALLAVDREQLAGALDEAVQVLEPGLRKANLAVGISAATAWRETCRAAEEARYARRLAERGSRRTSVVDGTELTASQLLSAALPAAVRAADRQRVLGPVLAYDAEHQSDLAETLRVFLQCSGSWKRAAQRLHLHVNTLRYRIDRIGQLTGLDLMSLATQVELHTALHLE